MLDTLTVKSLQLEGKHGFYESEREIGTLFELDVTVKGNFRDAARSDDLEKAFNYETVVSEAMRVMEGPSRKLIETLCHELGESLFHSHQQILFLEVAIRKLHPPLPEPAAYTEIRMEWQR